MNDVETLALIVGIIVAVGLVWIWAPYVRTLYALRQERKKWEDAR